MPETSDTGSRSGQTTSSSLMNAVAEAIAERSQGLDQRDLNDFTAEEQAALFHRANEILAARNDIVRRGQAIYSQQIGPRVEADNAGKFLVVDVDTGEYEMDADDLSALRRARGRKPDARLYLLRIGSPAAYRLRRQAMAVSR